MRLTIVLFLLLVSPAWGSEDLFSFYCNEGMRIDCKYDLGKSIACECVEEKKKEIERFVDFNYESQNWVNTINDEITFSCSEKRVKCHNLSPNKAYCYCVSGKNPEWVLKIRQIDPRVIRWLDYEYFMESRDECIKAAVTINKELKSFYAICEAVGF